MNTPAALLRAARAALGVLKVRRDAWVTLGCGLAGAIVVLVVYGHSSRIAQSHHGLWHAASIYQFVNGLSPPTNPLSLGAPTNYLSAYYALLARLVVWFETTPFQASVILNSAAFGVVLAAGAWAGRRSTPRAALQVAFALLPFLVLNPVGHVAYLIRQAVALLEGGPLAFDGPPNLHLLMPSDAILGISLDRRVSLPLVKFLNFTGQPVGMASFVVALHAMAFGRGFAATLVCGLSGFASMLFYPPAGLGVTLIGLAGIVAKGPASLRGIRSRDWNTLLQLGPSLAMGLGVLLATPLIASEAGNLGGFGVRVGGAGLLKQAVRQGWALWPMLPVFALALPQLRRSGHAARIYWVSGMAMLLANLFLSFPGRTEYKFAHFYAYPATSLALVLWRDRARGGLAGALVASALIPLLVTSWLYLRSSWAREEPWVYRTRVLDLAAEPEQPSWEGRRTAYAWLRENTPPAAYVLEAPVDMNDLALSAVAQRRTVAALAPNQFTRLIAHHRELVDASRSVASALVDCTLDARDLDRLFAVPAPWPEQLFALAPAGAGSHDRCARELPDRVRVTHSNLDYRVFEIRRWSTDKGDDGAEFDSRNG